jgi:trk system potassium uptake protein
MKIIVCGAGQVGYNIARYLAGAGNDVTVIDQRQELAQKIGESLDIQAITGFASHPEVLEQAGAADAELLIAVTNADEVNMVTCQIAHSLFNVPTKIARVRHRSYLQSRWQDLFRREHIPIDVIISPELEVARAIARRLEVPGATEVTPFAEDRVRLIAARCGPDCPILDTPLRQLTFLFPDLHLTCVGIIRDGHLFVPSGDDHLIAGDEVYSVVETSHTARAMRAFGHEEKMAERIVIAGGGNIGLFLAEQLQAAHRSRTTLTLIELDPTRARHVADRLSSAVVLNGDIRDPEILEEANLASAEAIVSVTNNDEINVMAALLAKRYGCHQALTLVNNTVYAPLLSSLAIDVVISPREATVSSVLRHVRRGRIKSAYSLRDGEAEVLEAEALETSPLVGQTLRDARLPGGVLVGAILRDGAMITPRADTVVRAHDRVIIVARASAVKKVEKLFAVRVDYF